MRRYVFALFALAGCTGQPIPIGNNGTALSCQSNADCVLANATSQCLNQLCSLTCNPGFADCDRNEANGCETNVFNDRGNCGACGSVCPTGDNCMAGSCINPVHATCTDGIKNGQETDVDCGGPQCPACQTGKACLVNGDCVSNACMANVCQPIAPCSCSLPHANAQCTNNGPCTIVSCDAGYADCNRLATDGCETLVATDVNNCGACGTACLPGDSCTAGTCVSPMTPTCTDGIKNGQETDVDCGGPQCPACQTGKACLVNGDCVSNACMANVCQPVACTCMLPNATSKCNAANMCVITVCNSGWADCDGNANDGCETNVTNDPRNCGGCGVVCPNEQNGTGACSNGQCVLMCFTPYADCDRNYLNGCETNVGSDPNNCGACGVVCPTGHACQAGACQ